MATNNATPVVNALEAKYYTDPDVYQRELDSLLARTWQFACHASQVANPGDYVCFDIAQQSLFVVRGKDGVVRCFYNVCQHRAHQMLEGEGSARVLVCPYHAWSYDLAGGLRGAPNSQSVPGFDKSSICLTEVRLQNFAGFLFVNLDPQAEPMEVWYPGVEAALREYVPDIEQLAPLEWVTVDEACNWKVSVENYSECYHCSINHPTFATGVVKPQTYRIDTEEGYVLRHTTECQPVESMSYPIDIDSNPHAGHYSSWFLWPMFSFQVYPGNRLNTYHWRDHGTERVEVVRGWFSHDGAEDLVTRQLARQDRDTTVAEDIRLVESVQRGLRSKGYKPGPLVIDPAGGVNSENSIAALHRWTREGIEA